MTRKLKIILVLMTPLFCSAQASQLDKERGSYQAETLSKYPNFVPRSLNSPSLPSPNVEAELREINRKIDQAIEKDKTTLANALIAALSGLLGVLIGGFVSYSLQRRQLEQDKALANQRATQENELAAKKASIEIASSVIEWRLQQLSLLYGPLRALLGQSRTLYEQMSDIVGKSGLPNFRLEGKTLQIFENGEWIRFRTVLHISTLYKRGLGVDYYIDEIVSLGERMVQIIEKHAGYVRADQSDLISIFAKYLAHFSVLKKLHDLAKKNFFPPPSTQQDLSTDTLDLKIRDTAVFPLKLHTLIEAGFQHINDELETWRKLASL